MNHEPFAGVKPLHQLLYNWDLTIGETDGFQWLCVLEAIAVPKVEISWMLLLFIVFLSFFLHYWYIILQGMNAGSFYKGLKYAVVHGGKPLSFHKGSTIYISITYHAVNRAKENWKCLKSNRWHWLFVHHEARANCKIFFKVRHSYLLHEAWEIRLKKFQFPYKTGPYHM